MADINDDMTMKRLNAAIDANVNSLKKKKENTFKVVDSICNEVTQIIFKEEIEYLFDVLSELPLEVEPYSDDKRFVNFIHDQQVVGTLAILEHSLEYYFDILGQYVSFKLEKQIANNQYLKNIYVDGREEGKFSSEKEEKDLPEITKMIYEIKEVINSDNMVVEQKFILKESSRDIGNIEDEYFAEESRELHITRYDSRLYDNGEIKAYSDCARGFSNAQKVSDFAKLPKAKIEYKEDFLPFSLLSNLEFIAKRMLCSQEFRGFKIEPIIEDCDDKYIYLTKINSEDWFDAGEELEHFRR